jgi:hypothetical protein
MLEGGSLPDRLRPLVDDVGGAQPPSCSLLDSLPSVHRELLRALNGFTVQQGAMRFFGVARNDALDLARWNDSESWRFAWDDRVEDFLFFASTAWGDQYAYRRGLDGKLEPGVHFLECTLLRPELIADSFEKFAEQELLRVAIAGPYDSLTIGALSRFGAIAPSEVWVFAPSIALGGEESLDNVVCLAAVDAMTMAGDIASALRASVPGSWPTHVDPWVDERGRQRLDVRFDRE